MDQALLFDICVAVATALCLALLLYGLWLCLPEMSRSPRKETAHERESDAVVR